MINYSVTTLKKIGPVDTGYWEFKVGHKMFLFWCLCGIKVKKYIKLLNILLKSWQSWFPFPMHKVYLVIKTLI